MLTNKEFFDVDFTKFMIKDYEDIRYRRKQMKSKPSIEELAIIDLERVFESFYRKFLY